jgi:hypothetical protein
MPTAHPAGRDGRTQESVREDIPPAPGAHASSRG